MKNFSFKRILIFGGSGFVGRHLTEYFSRVHDGETILADIAEPSWDTQSNCTYQYCDVREPIGGLGSNIDLAINLAAVHRTPGHDEREYFETNVLGAENVTSYCEETGIERLWFTSSIAVYGAGETLRDEQSVPTPNTAYGTSKLVAETIHKAWATRNPECRRLLVVRPAVIFGPGEFGNFSRLGNQVVKQRFVYPGRRDTTKACGYVRDLPRALEHMESYADPELVFNFCYPLNHTIEEICTSMANVAKCRPPRVRVPAPLINFAAHILSYAGWKTFDPNRVSKLQVSTAIAPEELKACGFSWPSTLDRALREWFEEAPEGKFL